MNNKKLHISTIELSNFRCFENLLLDLHPRLNIFLGANGSGKSTIIDALAIILCYLLRNIINDRLRPYYMALDDEDILISKSSTAICAELIHKEAYYIGIERKKNIARQTVGTKKTKEYLEKLQNILKSDAIKLPIFVKYHATRHTTINLNSNIFLRKFSIFDCYTDALIKDDKIDEFLIWFKQREDMENESIRRAIYKDNNRKEIPIDNKLQSIRNALNIFSQFSNFYVNRESQQFMVTKNEQDIPFNKLSDGEKNYILLVGDIARRLAIANPTSGNPLEGEGIILIDEIELHLHPKWQRMIIPQLLKTFPNCQFIVSSHSPQVLGEVEPESVWLLEEGQEPYHPDRSLGMTSSELLTEVMGDTLRNKKVADELEAIDRLIESEHYDEARKGIKELAKLTGNIPAIIGANSYLTMMGEEQAEIEEQ